MIDNQKTILIAGYYGFNNTGDEAILAAMILDLRALRPNVEIIVVSGDPQDTEKSHGVRGVSWNDIQGIIHSIKVCDLVILGGGGLFHDYWGFDPASVLTQDHAGIAFYSSIALLASIQNKPLMLYAVGVGPLLSEEGKLYTRATAEQACLVSVRDEASKAWLCSLGRNPDHIHVTADPAFSLDPIDSDSEIKRLIAQAGPILGVAVRNWDVGVLPDYWERQVAEAIDSFLDFHGGNAVFIPFQERGEALLDDLGISQRIQRRMRNSERTLILHGDYSPAEKAGLIAECDLLLGMRLHAIIFAIRGETPAVGLVYDLKVQHLMTQAGIDKYAIDLGEVNGQSLASLLEDAHKNRDALAKQMHAVRPILEEKARENAELAVGVMNQASNVQQPLTSEAARLLKRATLSLSQALVERSRRTKELRNTIVDLQAKLESQALEHTRAIKKLRNTINALRAELASQAFGHTQAIKELRTELQTQIATLKTKHDEEVSKRDQVISGLQNELEGAEQKVQQQALAIRDLNAELGTQRTSHKAKIRVLEQHVAQANVLISEKDNSLHFLDSQLQEIKGSRGWKLLWGLWETRSFFIPQGSWREKILRKIWNGLRGNPIEFTKKASRKVSRKLAFRMSRHAFAFDLYKRSRSSTYPPNLSSLRLPNQNGLVSIVLPVYNGADLVSEAVDSILSQTYENFELIAINDGSQDATGEILDEYARQDERIQVIHQENKKLPQTLSRGFQEAQGEYLTWISHDNCLKPEFLEKMVACLQRHPTWDMIYANQDMIGEDGAPLHRSDWYEGYQRPPGSAHVHLPKDTAELNTWPNNFIGGGFLYRDRVAWLIGDYSPHRYTREDYDYWMRVNSLLTLRHVDFQEPLYDYRFHSDSLTNKDEELGITRDRKNLMVFDDFRRDFFLTPLIWLIEEDNSVDHANEDISALQACIHHAGHMFAQVGQFKASALPYLWVPSVYLKLTTSPKTTSSPPENLPPNTAKILLCLTTNNLPQSLDSAWDLCLAYGPEITPPKSDQNRQGWLISHEMKTLFAAIDIHARSQHLEKVEREIAQPSTPKYKASVIVCTYKRQESLENTLCSVAQQTMSQAEYEVLVVNNDPADNKAAPLIEKIRTENFTKNPTHIRLLICPILGLSHARNAGISEAKGEILLFLDDDATAEEDVLEQYWKAFSEHPDAGVVGGHIHLNPPEPMPMLWSEGWESYWSQFITGHRDYTPVEHWWEYPWGANWCAKREALLRIGGFRGGYGRRGNDFSGGEEIVAASLIKRLGYTIAVLPQAKVIHHIEASRFTLSHLKQTIRAGLFTQYQAQVELRIPMETSIGSNVKQMNNSLLKLLPLFHPKDPRKKSRLVETHYYLSARWHLFLRQVADYFKRFRRPVTRN